ncbi:putative membrane protein [Bradyrhizobium huanghuaihaiense]|jgi:uncharacterized membrane protein|uniref:Putative membrane protein n=1 Tax=Bradyrhizobium huanghuaihaiense TaxID=990078 RepID=A0A562S5X9_9BRAD|nr:NEW3 domain-containing protein [Bradyrhizobium huanghuaihaiense]TWI76513.1 putative membrane protein [Bradyrhizobium huanghuaihaiense]
MRSFKRGARFFLSVVLATLIGPAASLAAETSPPLTGLWITTPHPEFSLKPGEAGSIQLSVRNAHQPPQRLGLSLEGLPEGWEAAFKGGGRQVSAVMVGPDETERLTLELKPPAGISAGTFALKVNARQDGQTISLPLSVRLSEAASGKLTLEPELPALRGTPRSTFSFRIKATNGGSDQSLFNLSARTPEGFQAKFKRGYGSEEITGLPINAGSSENITLDIVPSRAAPAGRYPIAVRLSGGDKSAETALSLEVTGEPQLRMVGPQERLSGDAVAGEESNFTFSLVNGGSAPATDIEMSASPPSGWSVTFEPKQIGSIAPNQTREVNVKIKPSERAVAGDYMVTLRSGGGGGLSESVQFRTTVRTSTIWGVAGLGVIAAAVLVLGGAVMRYGRR